MNTAAHEPASVRRIMEAYGSSSSPGPDLHCRVADQRGRSGADITPKSHDQIDKYGPPNTALGSRVVAQGEWILRHRNQALPTVRGVFRNNSQWGYTMDRLDTIPLELLDGRKLATSIVRLLKSSFWRQPPEAEFDESAHADRLSTITAPLTGRRREVFDQLRGRIEWDRLSRGLTHGDPIFDNVLFARDGSTILIDPIPSTPGLPDVIALDIGRIFQSCVGYERVTYELPAPDNVPLDIIISMTGLAHDDLIAALYFGIVHLLRSMVYVSARKAKHLLEECVDSLIGAATCRL